VCLNSCLETEVKVCSTEHRVVYAAKKMKENAKIMAKFSFDIPQQQAVINTETGNRISPK